MQQIQVHQHLSKFYKFIVVNGIVTCGYFKNFEYVFIELYNVSAIPADINDRSLL